MENFMEYFVLALIVAGGLVGTAIAYLKVRAPKTETTKDDRVLEILEHIQKFIVSGQSVADKKSDQPQG